MKRFRLALFRMTPSQRNELRAELASLELWPATATVIEGRIGDAPACPHCTVGRVI